MQIKNRRGPTIGTSLGDILFLVNRFWKTKARMPLDVGRELTSTFLTLYTVLYHMNISLLHHNDTIA